MNELIDALENWGQWLRHDAHIGPESVRCMSAESRHVPDAGEIWDGDLHIVSVPDVDRAEMLDEIIRAHLGRMHQIALAVRYGGMPAVFRVVRTLERSMIDMADEAERHLQWIIEKQCLDIQ